LIAKRTLLPILALAATTAPALSQESKEAEAERIRRMAEVVNRPVVYSVPGMDRVTVRKDLVYKTTDDPNMRMDVYSPPAAPGAAGGKRPAVIFVHGGAPTRFRPKDWGVFESWGGLVAASGMVGVTFTYSMSFPASRLLDGASDVADAIAYVRSHADDLGIDRDRLCLVAYSAGGPMLSPYLRGAPEPIRCLVGFYPLMDVRKPPQPSSEPPELLERFSPIVQLSRGAGRLMPLLIAQGRKDEVPTLLDSVDRFVAEALVHGVPLTVMSHPTAPHAFDNQLADDRTREIVRGALDFLRWHLGLAGEAK